MIWKTTNGLGKEVTWYSEDEILKLFILLSIFSGVNNDWFIRNNIYGSNNLYFNESVWQRRRILIKLNS